MLKAVEEAMTRFELGGKRPPLLEKLYLALDTVAATSTEAERGFRQDLHCVSL